MNDVEDKEKDRGKSALKPRRPLNTVSFDYSHLERGNVTAQWTTDEGSVQLIKSSRTDDVCTQKERFRISRKR